MRRAALAVAAAVAALTSTFACSRPEPALHVYTWADYVKPELVTRFEQEQHCRVVIDTFDSNEAMFAKMKAGASGYDVVTPSSYMVAIMHQQGMLQDLDRSLLPNTKNLDPDYLKIALDPQLGHSVPYMLTITGIGYLKSRVEGFEPTWKVLERQDLKSRMTMLNDMRETIGAGLKSLGYSLNTRDEAQLQAARDVVIGWRKNLAKLENEQYKTGLASGEFLLVHGYSGDIFQVQAENDDIEFAVPVEGTSVACDDLVIPTGAQQVTLAHAYINFLHDPEVAAENTDFISYLCPNLPSYDKISDEMKAFRELFTRPEVRERSEVIQDLGEDNAKYAKVWDEIKAAD